LRTQKRMESSAAAAVDNSVRVRTDRLDKLIDMVGELVIAQSMLSQDETVVRGGHIELVKKITHSSKLIRELQDLSMSMRMVPLRATFQKMTRLVRDLAHKSGKHVDFVSEGEDTEIDRNMVDVLNDPLVHIIRNSVDHGIEPPDVRQSAGKPPGGTVRLAAFHAGGNVVVELHDDGKGLDRDKILQKAIAKGLVESDRVMTDNEITNLIFAPGFSTADKVTDVSGRGVGMDVVKRSIEKLHGKIEVSSEFGRGCLLTMRVPLTLAITDGMLVKVGTERYLLPTANIYISFRPEAEALSTIAGRGEMVMLRGELLPVFRLHRLFNVEGAVENPREGLLVVIGDGEDRCALLVDELLGQHQVVAKSLGAGIGKILGVAGGAILGTGRVGLILDPTEISSLARQAC
jgi:two-component system, chemotaxis family, sensor kinase CheA